MILDSFFAFAAVILLAALVCLAVVFANEVRRLKEAVASTVVIAEGWADESQRWKEAYEAKAAQAEKYLGQIAAFDHDGDGRVGGSLPKANLQAAGYKART